MSNKCDFPLIIYDKGHDCNITTSILEKSSSIFRQPAGGWPVAGTGTHGTVASGDSCHDLDQSAPAVIVLSSDEILRVAILRYHAPSACYYNTPRSSQCCTLGSGIQNCQLVNKVLPPWKVTRS